MASAFDLCSLSDLKRWLGVVANDDDQILAQLITQTSGAILASLDRMSILPRTHSEAHDGGGAVSILLREWPVNAVISCSLDNRPVEPSLASDSGRTMEYLLEPPDVAPPGRPQRFSLYGAVFAKGIQNLMISYSAGYQINGEEATVPSAPPYNVLPLAPFGQWGSDIAVEHANGAPFLKVAANPAAGQYAITDRTYIFSAADAGAPMRLTYGYVPIVLGASCMDWAAERYAYRSRIGQSSKSLGGHETIAFIKDIPDYVARGLQPYRRVVMP